MISFDNVDVFYILGLLIFIFLVSAMVKNYEQYFSKEMLNKIIIGTNRKRLSFIFLILSFIFLIISLARPVIKNKPIKVSQSNISIVVAFDISGSMRCDDVYPNRLNFSKNKFNNILINLKDEKVGAIGFSSESFLVAPITNDYSTLKYLVENLDQDSINVKGSKILGALETANSLLKNQSQKAVIVFTDGTDTKDFKPSIQYAKDNNIKVFVYAIATQKGGVINTKSGEIQKDAKGDIVITSLNSKIKELAFESGGAYLEFSSSANDISKFIDIIKVKFKSNKKEEVLINTNQELFYIPLAFGFLFFIISISSFRRERK